MKLLQIKFGQIKSREFYFLVNGTSLTQLMTHYLINWIIIFLKPHGAYKQTLLHKPHMQQQCSQTLHTLESLFIQRMVFSWWSFGLNHLCRVGLSYTTNSRAVVSRKRQVKNRRSAALVPEPCQPQRAWILSEISVPDLSRPGPEIMITMNKPRVAITILTPINSK